MKNKKSTRGRNGKDPAVWVLRTYLALISADDFGERPEDFSLADELVKKICQAETENKAPPR